MARPPIEQGTVFDGFTTCTVIVVRPPRLAALNEPEEPGNKSDEMRD